MELPQTRKNQLPEELASLDKAVAFIQSSDVQKTPSEFVTKEYFTTKNQYAREILLPAGTLILSHWKRHDGITVLSHGVITEISAEGCREMMSPMTWIHPPKSRRVIYAHTDAVLVCFHDEKAGITPEEVLIIDNPKQLEGLPWHGQLQQ